MYCGEVRCNMAENIFYFSTYTYTMLLFGDSREIPVMDNRQNCNLETVCVPYSLHILTLILRRSRTGTVWFYTSTSNKRVARPKLYTKSLKRDLKRMYSRLTLVRISINL